jgi:CRP-like cAMP-binding protein
LSESAIIDALGKSPLGADLDDQERETLAKVMRLRRLADGDVLFEEGGVDQSLFLLLSGRLAVTRDVAGEDRITLHVLRPGELVGEMGFIGGEPHIATLRALGDTEILALDRGDFETLVPEQPWLVYRLMSAIMRSVHATMHRVNLQFIEMQNYVTKSHGRY